MSPPPTIDVQVHARGIIVPVRASAGARRNGVIGGRNGALRVAVTAAPEKSKANAAIVEVLSKALGVPKSAIELIAGETSPQKRLLIVCNDAQRVRQVIEELVEKTQ
jgi:uncharacterized protein (TIGR00251 family)